MDGIVRTIVCPCCGGKGEILRACGNCRHRTLLSHMDDNTCGNPKSLYEGKVIVIADTAWCEAWQREEE